MTVGREAQFFPPAGGQELLSSTLVFQSACRQTGFNAGPTIIKYQHNHPALQEKQTGNGSGHCETTRYK